MLCNIAQIPFNDHDMLALILIEADMAVALKRGRSKSSTILFAFDFSTNERAFSFALTQAVEFDTDLNRLGIAISITF